jgi:hypothetical protein
LLACLQTVVTVSGYDLRAVFHIKTLIATEKRKKKERTSFVSNVRGNIFSQNVKSLKKNVLCFALNKLALQTCVYFRAIF